MNGAIDGKMCDFAPFKQDSLQRDHLLLRLGDVVSFMTLTDCNSQRWSKLVYPSENPPEDVQWGVGRSVFGQVTPLLDHYYPKESKVYISRLLPRSNHVYPSTAPTCGSACPDGWEYHMNTTHEIDPQIDRPPKMLNGGASQGFKHCIG